MPGDEQPVAKTERVDAGLLDTWIDGGTLEVIGGERSGAVVEIGEDPVLIGRAAGCDLVIDDARVSAAHCELRPEEHGVVLRDLDTTNGTWVGPLRVREAILGDGVEILVGATKIRFRYADTPHRQGRSDRSDFYGLVGSSPPMRALYAQLEKLAPASLSVLIEGETGTGKEQVARALHAASPRADGPFVVVDCGALPPSLIESTLFGHEKGAFSGAATRHVGLIESADHGTLLLDEVGELPLEMQTRLLRVLEARTIRRVGGSKEILVDVRVLGATHRDLPAMVSAGAFRSDLFFRLATARLRVPSLRQRRADVPALAEVLLARIAGDPPPRLSDEALEVLERYDFPGNVRELRNMLEVASAFSDGTTIGATDLRGSPSIDHPSHTRAAPIPAPASAPAAGEIPLYREAKEAALDAFDRAYFERLIADAGGNITRAAARAGIERHHLRAILKKRGIR